MQFNPVGWHDIVPVVIPGLEPPGIHAAAALAHGAYGGATLPDLLAWLDRPALSEEGDAALMLDQALAHRLHFQAAMADALQALALSQCGIFRVKLGPDPGSARPLRALALVAPGDLMVNTPLEFITRHLDVRLDLLFVRPDHALPCCVPDHDVAFFAVSESDPATLRRLRPLFREWPRPALNDPAAIERLSRDVVSRGLAGRPGIRIAWTRRVPRAELAAPAPDFPLLVRPVGTHAGERLELMRSAADLEGYRRLAIAPEFFLTEFVDYRGADGLFRKYRIAFVEGAPFLCHMAVSEHWMVHYLNADMSGNAARRDEEARAMEEFDTGFARRHAAAFAELHAWMGLDYHQVDCAETPDGRLLVFEADVAAIVHLMDPPDLFPYKPARMRRVFAAFDGMLRRAKARRYELSFAKSEAMV